MGIQLGITPSWEARASSAAGAPPCLAWVSDAIELQALVCAAAAEPPSASASASASTSSSTAAAACVTAALAASPVLLHVPAVHVAAAMCVADALAAEGKRAYDQGLPSAGAPAFQHAQPARAPWLSAVALEAHGLALTCALLGGEVDSSSWQVPLAVHQQHEPIPAVLQCARLGAAVVCDQLAITGTCRPFMAVTVIQMHAVLTEHKLAVLSPAADVSIGRLPISGSGHMPEASDSIQAPSGLPAIRTGRVAQQPPTMPQHFTPLVFQSCTLGSSIALASSLRLEASFPGLPSSQPRMDSDTHAAQSHSRQGPMRLLASLQDVSLALLPAQIALLSSLIALTSARPALPAMSSYPPVMLAHGPCIEVTVSVGSISGQLMSTEPTAQQRISPGLAGHGLQLYCCIGFNITWVGQRALLVSKGMTLLMHTSLHAHVRPVWLHIFHSGTNACKAILQMVAAMLPVDRNAKSRLQGWHDRLTRLLMHET